MEEIAKANANGYHVYNRGASGGVAADVTIGDKTHKGKIVKASKMSAPDKFSLDGAGSDTDADNNLTVVTNQLKNRKYRGIDAAECMIGTDQTTAKGAASTTKVDRKKVFRKMDNFGTDTNGIEFNASTVLKYSIEIINTFLGED